MSIVEDRPAPSGLTYTGQVAPVADAAGDDTLVAAHRPRRVSISVPDGENEQRLVIYLERTLNDLLALPAGWDGYRAKPIQPGAAVGLTAALNRLLQPTSAPPQLFPLPDGGIQAEWLIGGNSIEVEVGPEGDAFVLATTSTGDTAVEGPLDTLHVEVADRTGRFLAQLSARLTAFG